MSPFLPVLLNNSYRKLASNFFCTVCAAVGDYDCLRCSDFLSGISDRSQAEGEVIGLVVSADNYRKLRSGLRRLYAPGLFLPRRLGESLFGSFNLLAFEGVTWQTWLDN